MSRVTGIFIVVKSEIEDNNVFKVYIHKNKINGKMYIGITMQKVEKRWNNGKGYKTQIIFCRAIKKYGWENFEHITLFDKLTKTEAEDIEIELIKFNKSNNPKYGYNVAKGGNICSDSTREKMSKIFKGRKLSPEHLENVIKANGKNIICLETGKIFRTITEAGKYLKINRYSISNSCNSKKKSADGLHFMFLEKYDKNKEYTFKPYKRKVICINTGEIFNSIRETSRKLNINSGDICNICKGKLKTINGLAFKYLEEVENKI